MARRDDIPKTDPSDEAKCLAHARRKFVEIEQIFPLECAVVLDAIGQVYQMDRATVRRTKGRAEQRFGPGAALRLEALGRVDEISDCGGRAAGQQHRRTRIEASRAAAKERALLQERARGRGGRDPAEFDRASIIVSASGQKNVRQKNKETRHILHFSVSHFSVRLVSVAETMIEALDRDLPTLMRERPAARANPEAYLPWNYARGEPGEEAEARAA